MYLASGDSRVNKEIFPASLTWSDRWEERARKSHPRTEIISEWHAAVTTAMQPQHLDTAPCAQFCSPSSVFFLMNTHLSKQKQQMIISSR